MSRTRIESPVYQQIAVDLAVKIASGKYQEKERIRGRSTLASYYNVSPETIRKAVYILEDVGIVTIHQGIGIEVASAEKAREFQEKYSNIYNLNSLKKELLDLLHQHQEQERLLKEKVNDLIDSTERFQNVNPFIPFELVITRDMKYLEMCIRDRPTAVKKRMFRL